MQEMYNFMIAEGCAASTYRADKLLIISNDQNHAATVTSSSYIEQAKKLIISNVQTE